MTFKITADDGLGRWLKCVARFAHGEGKPEYMYLGRNATTRDIMETANEWDRENGDPEEMRSSLFERIDAPPMEWLTKHVREAQVRAEAMSTLLADLKEEYQRCGGDPDELPPSGILAVRDPLRRFALYQELILQENDHKGGWTNTGQVVLLRRLLEETAELVAEMRPKADAQTAIVELLRLDLEVTRELLMSGVRRLDDYGDHYRYPVADPQKVRHEAADVANFAMMIGDVQRPGGAA